MTTNWSHEKRGDSGQVEREPERRRAHLKSLVPMQTPHQGSHPLPNRAEAESVPTAGYAPWKTWFIGWDVMLAVLAGVVIFFFLDVASFGVLGSALTVAAIVAAIGLGHYLLWGRVFARGVLRERQRVQDQARRLETTKTEPPDEFVLELNDRERMELLQLLEQSLVETTAGREGRGESAVIRRELQHRIRMFGA
jgi:hypothetical protein